jgi:hypothetical protein
MPGISPMVAATEEEARAKYRTLEELIPDAVGVAVLASYLSLKGMEIRRPSKSMRSTSGNN